MVYNGHLKIKEVRGNTEQGTCVCDKEEGWSHMMGCEETEGALGSYCAKDLKGIGEETGIRRTFTKITG
jgi:hypothetical protein